MNTTPDDELLALWVEDELDASASTQVDAWAVLRPEWMARREQVREWKSLMQGALPASVEPPYGDFFNARIAREIERGAGFATRRSRRSWWGLWLPATALAGMMLCFWAGTRMVPSESVAVPAAERAEPVLYTPEKGVKASFFDAGSADAMVIVLDGVEAIPDNFELPETAARPAALDETADVEVLAP